MLPALRPSKRLAWSAQQLPCCVGGWAWPSVLASFEAESFAERHRASTVVSISRQVRRIHSACKSVSTSVGCLQMLTGGSEKQIHTLEFRIAKGLRLRRSIST